MDAGVRRWVAEVAGGSVQEIRSLTFGVTSDLRLLDVDGQHLVLRRYLDHSLLQRMPNIVADEATALVAARRILGTLVPELIAFDEFGQQTGHPALLMTYLPGVARIHDLDTARLAVPLAALHASTVAVVLRPVHRLSDLTSLAIPRWTSAPGAWTALLEVVADPAPPRPHVFLHRDFHPGNLVWDQQELAGVVDWAFACRGPAAIDIAHTRYNLALVDGVAAAESFLAAYAARSPSYEHHVWWDATEVLTWDDDFAGVVAFNSFGADLNVELLRSRADTYAVALARSASR
jgi:aminoglycoside phosphotransferase (APT) family kinase protein